MSDSLTKEKRSWNMSRIRSSNTKIEVALRKALWAQGYRYRKNYKKLIGKPDIVLTKYKIAVFCDSEFWHGKDWDELEKELEHSNHSDFWVKKIARNIERDKEVNEKLKEQGWTVLRFWGKDIEKHTDKCVDRIEEAVRKNSENSSNKSTDND